MQVSYTQFPYLAKKSFFLKLMRIPCLGVNTWNVVVSLKNQLINSLASLVSNQNMGVTKLTQYLWNIMMINVIFKQKKLWNSYMNLEALPELNLLSSGGILGLNWNKV